MDPLDTNLERIRAAVNNRLGTLKASASPDVVQDADTVTHVKEAQEKAKGWWLNWKNTKS